MLGIVCDPQKLATNTITDVQVALDGRIRYLRQLQLDADFITSLWPLGLRIAIPVTLLATEVTEIGTFNTPVVVSRYLEKLEDTPPGVQGSIDPEYHWIGTRAVALHPSLDSNPLVEVGIINQPGYLKSQPGNNKLVYLPSGPETHLLNGAEIPAASGTVDYVAWVGADQCYLARNGHIWLIIRQIARIVYDGPIRGMTTGPDGTLLASDGVQLLRLRPDEFGEAIPARTTATPRLNWSIIAEPTSGPNIKLEVGGSGGGYVASGSGRYQIEMSEDLEKWTTIFSGRYNGDSILQPLSSSGRAYYRATISGAP